MKFGLRIMLTIAILMVILSSVIFVTSRQVLLRGFSRLENDEAMRNLRRAQSALDNVIAAMDVPLTDWSNWDGTYRSARDSDGNFIRKNVVKKTFDVLRINVGMMMDRRGRILFRRAMDLSTLKDMPVTDGEWERLRRVVERMMRRKPQGVRGLTAFHDGTLMVAMRPVLTTEGKGPAAGTLVMGKFLTAAMARDLSSRTHMNLTVYPVDHPPTGVDGNVARSMIALHETVRVRVMDPKHIAGYLMVKDLNGRPIFALRSYRNRIIYLQANRTLAQLYWWTFIAGLLFCVVALSILYWRVFRPMALYERSIMAIGEQKDLSVRLPVKLPVELAALAGAINRMLDSLEQAHRELVRSRVMYQAIVEGQSEIIIRFRPGGVYTFVNPAFARLHGKTPEEMIGKEIDARYHSLEFGWMREHIRMITAEEPSVDFEQKLSLKQGEPRWVEWKCLGIFDDRESVTEYQMVGRDITDRKRAEDALFRARKFASIAQLSMGLSHEIKNPLSIIEAHVETLLENERVAEVADEKVKYSFSVISTQVERIANVLNSLSSLSRGGAFCAAPLNVTKQMTTLTDMFRPILRKNGVRLENSFGAEDGLIIEADVSRFVQIVTNLIINALESMPNGGVLGIDARRAEDGEFVEVAVTDSGRGIAEEDMGRVFHPYFTTNPNGMGMGLSICRQYVEDHGGTIRLQSRVGEGTKAIVSFPAQQRPKAGDDEDQNPGG